MIVINYLYDLPFFRSSAEWKRKVLGEWQWSRRFGLGPGFQDWNLMQFKRFAINERMNLEFDCEAYDFINHRELGGDWSDWRVEFNPTIQPVRVRAISHVTSNSRYVSPSKLSEYRAARIPKSGRCDNASAGREGVVR